MGIHSHSELRPLHYSVERPVFITNLILFFQICVLLLFRFKFTSILPTYFLVHFGNKILMKFLSFKNCTNLLICHNNSIRLFCVGLPMARSLRPVTQDCGFDPRQLHIKEVNKLCLRLRLLMIKYSNG